MRIMIESTGQTPTIDGVQTRLWHGVTESGNECALYVHRLQVATEDAAEFDRELREMPPAVPPAGLLPEAVPGQSVGVVESRVHAVALMKDPAGGLRLGIVFRQGIASFTVGLSLGEARKLLAVLPEAIAELERGE